MYEAFFGLSKKPFQLTPDPTVFFESSPHKKALSYLQYGLTQQEGFIVITGGVGTGKTTIANYLINQVESSKVIAKQLVVPNLSPDDLIISITKLFHLRPDGDSKAAHLAELTEYMERQSRLGRRLLLIIDEAQNLPADTIEQLRMLSNIQANGQAIIQSFLLGQTELEETLSKPKLEQFRQRVIASAKLIPLNAEELMNYINFRMEAAGWIGNSLFSPEAVALIHSFTGGIPRRINTFLDRVLLYAYLEEKHHIDEAVVQNVIAEVEPELTHQYANPNSEAESSSDEVDQQQEPEVKEQPEVTNNKTKSVSQGLNEETSELLLEELLKTISSGDLATEKIEMLLESVLLMTRRSVAIQGQILKELRELKSDAS